MYQGWDVPVKPPGNALMALLIFHIRFSEEAIYDSSSYLCHKRVPS